MVAPSPHTWVGLLGQTEGLSMWGLHVLPISLWVFLPQFKNMLLPGWLEIPNCHYHSSKIIDGWTQLFGSTKSREVEVKTLLSEFFGIGAQLCLCLPLWSHTEWIAQLAAGLTTPAEIILLQLQCSTLIIILQDHIRRLYSSLTGKHLTSQISWQLKFSFHRP